MIPRGLAPGLCWAWVAAMLIANRSIAGVWGMDPVFGITGDHATNPVLLNIPDTAESNVALLLDAPTTYNADAFKFSLLPSFRLGDARGYSSVTSDYEHLNAKSEFDTERSTLTATLGAARDSSLYFNGLSNGTTGVRRDSAIADADWDRLLTEHFEINTDVNATRVRYGDALGTNTLVDFKYGSIVPTLSWITAERDKITLSASLGRYNSLSGTTESRSGSAQLGFVRQLTEQWTLTASGGYSRALNQVELEEPFIVFTPYGPVLEFLPATVKSSQNGAVYSVNLAHQGSLLTLAAIASRLVVPTGFAYLSRQSTYEVTANYVLSPRWTLSADARYLGYQNPLPTGQSSEVRVPYLGINASWLWTEQWTVTLGASRVREAVQMSSINVASTEVTITLSHKFNHMKFQ